MAPTVDLGIQGLEEAAEIGRGGFGVVFRALQPAFRRQVAVKLLSVGVFDEATRRRFVRECEAMGSLSGHPNIVTLYDAGMTADGRPYLVMEYLARGSLEDRVAQRGPLPWAEVLEIGVKVAGALESAHRIGVLHRDVTPGNVLVSDFGEPLLTDFGIARVAQASMVSSTRAISGTPAHLAPEVLAGEPSSARSDVYSLGSTLFTLLTGRPAFVRDGDESVFALMRRVASEPLPDLTPLDVPAELVALLAAAMAKSPSDRPEAAVAVAVGLNEVARVRGLGSTPVPIASNDPSARTRVHLPLEEALPAVVKPAVPTTQREEKQREERESLRGAEAAPRQTGRSATVGLAVSAAACIGTAGILAGAPLWKANGQSQDIFSKFEPARPAGILALIVSVMAALALAVSLVTPKRKASAWSPMKVACVLVVLMGALSIAEITR